VRLDRGRTLTIEIRDDGRGIAAGVPAGVGLTAMQERANELGGQLSITSTSAGTTVSAMLPILETS
jgi:signal transduction histidine kinase